jgi:PAS domain S-box-containing protein
VAFAFAQADRFICQGEKLTQPPLHKPIYHRLRNFLTSLLHQEAQADSARRRSTHNDQQLLRSILVVIFVAIFAAFVWVMIAGNEHRGQNLPLLAASACAAVIVFAINEAQKTRAATFMLSIFIILAFVAAGYPDRNTSEFYYSYFLIGAIWLSSLLLPSIAVWIILLITLGSLVVAWMAAPSRDILHALYYPGIFLTSMTLLIVIGSRHLRRSAQIKREELLRNQTLLHTITSNLLEVIGVTDAEYRVLFISPSIKTLLGYEPQEVLAGDRPMQLVQFVHPDDRQALVDTLSQINRGRTQSRVEWRMRHKDGHYVWLETLIKLDLDSENTIRAYVYISRDITDRKAAEQSLIAERNLLRNVIDSMPQYVYLKDRDSRYLLNNRMHMRLLRAEHQEEIVGKSDADFFPEHMAREYLHDDQHIIQSGLPMLGKIEQILSPDRNPIWGLVTKVPLRDVEGNIIGLVGSTIDVTKDIEVREALIKSEATKKALLEAVPDLICRLTGEGILVDYKPSRMIAASQPADQMVGRNLQDVLPKDIAKQHHALSRRALETSEAQIFEYEIDLGNEIRHYEARIVVSGTDEVTSIIRDVSDRKQAEMERLERERLEGALEKERELGDLRKLFTTTLSHEFRTPLATVISSVEMLENYGDRMSSERRQESLETIRSQINYLVHMLNDILTIMQVQGSQLRFNPVPTDIHGFLQGIVKEFQTSIGAQHQLTMNVTEDVETPLIDQRLLRYILFNLLSNAIKYSLQGTEITASADRTSDHLRVRVIDRGIGIPEADRNQLFQAFHRARNVKSIAGSGLGLKIVKDCVDLHYGQISIDSTENVGTTVTLLLPLRPPRDRLRTTTSEVPVQ